MTKALKIMLALTVMAAAIPACSPKYSFKSAVDKNTPEAYKAFIAANPEDPKILEAESRLEGLEFTGAVKTGTILAYKRYLRDFPNGVHADAAKRFLEDLRFRQAAAENTRQAYANFLYSYPDGESGRKARQAIMELDYKNVNMGDPASIRRFLAQYPDSPKKAELKSLIDDTEFATAKKLGERGLSEFVATHAESGHMHEARGILLSASFDRAISACMLERASKVYAEMKADPSLDKACELKRQALDGARRVCGDRAELLKLDPALLRKLSGGGSRFSRQAEGALKLYSRDRKRFEALREQTIDVLAHRETPPLKRLAAMAASQDPFARLDAVKLLGFKPSSKALDLALELLSDRNYLVRKAAFRSVQSVVSGMNDDLRDRVIGRRLAALRGSTASENTQMRLAALYTATGMKLDALAALRRAAMQDRTDILARELLREAEGVSGERRKAVAVAIEEAQLAMIGMIEREEMLGSASGGADKRQMALQYCGYMEALTDAAATLSGLDASEQKSLSEQENAFVSSTLKAIDPRKAILRKAAANLQTDERLLCGKTGSEDLVEKGRAKRLSEYRDVVRSKAPWAPALACRLKDREQDAAIRRLAAIDCESAR